MSRWFEEYGHARVAPGLLIGAYPLDAADVGVLAGAGVRRVLSLVRDEEYAPGEHATVAAAYAAGGIEEVRLGTVDFGGLMPGLLERASDRVLGWLRAGETAYVHCRAGWQRSATVAAGTLARLDGTSPEEALRRVREARPQARPLPHQVEDLLAWWAERGGPDG